MDANAKKNRVMFLGGTIIVGAIAIFISLGIFATPQTARAYAVGNVATNTAGSGSGSYNIGASLKSLVSPFTGFINSLKFDNNTTINTGGPVQSAPIVDLIPATSSGAQNILSQWLSKFDNWFYGISGIRLSGILYVILNAFAWTLGLAQEAVKWLLGLFQ